MAAYKVWISWCQTYLQILLDAKKKQQKLQQQQQQNITVHPQWTWWVVLLAHQPVWQKQWTARLFSDVGVSDRAHGWVTTKKHRPHINYRDATLQEVRKHLQSGESDHRQVLIWTWEQQLQIEALWVVGVWEPLKTNQLRLFLEVLKVQK